MTSQDDIKNTILLKNGFSLDDPMNNLAGRCLQMKSSGSPPPQHWLELLGKSHFYQRDKQQIMTWQQQFPCPLSAFDMHLVYTNSYDLFEKNHWYAWLVLVSANQLSGQINTRDVENNSGFLDALQEYDFQEMLSLIRPNIFAEVLPKNINLSPAAFVFSVFESSENMQLLDIVSNMKDILDFYVETIERGEIASSKLTNASLNKVSSKRLREIIKYQPLLYLLHASFHEGNEKLLRQAIQGFMSRPLPENKDVLRGVLLPFIISGKAFQKCKDLYTLAAPDWAQLHEQISALMDGAKSSDLLTVWAQMLQQKQVSPVENFSDFSQNHVL